MAKRPQYDRLDSGLLVPDWFPGRRRNELRSAKDFLFTPGAGCECEGAPTCTIGGDDFSVDDLESNWTPMLGWEGSIADGVLEQTADGVLLFNAEHPGEGFHPYVIQVRIKPGLGTAQIVFDYDIADDNYNAAVILSGVGSGSITLHETLTSVDYGSVGNLSFTPGNWYNFKVCVHETYAIVAYEDDNGPGTLFGAIPSATTRVGLGSFSIEGVGFDDFLYSLHGSEVAGCPDCMEGDMCLCPLIENPLKDSWWEVVVENIRAGDSCCPSLNGGYELIRLTDGQLAAFGCSWAALGDWPCCGWYFLFPTPVCNINFGMLGVEGEPGNIIIYFSFEECVPGNRNARINTFFDPITSSNQYISDGDVFSSSPLNTADSACCVEPYLNERVTLTFHNPL